MRAAIETALCTAMLVAVSAAASAQPRDLGAAPKALIAEPRPVRSCESLATLPLPNTTIDSAALTPATGTRDTVCRVTAVVTHPPAGDQVKVFVALPVTGWNGRFLGVGGGGFSGGNAASVLLPARQGFAAGATDTGHEGGRASFALDSEGHLDWLLIRDNAYLGIHEMTVTAKALVEAFYGKPPRYSYFNGCSTGGRQGLMEAQRYPADYDGIASGCPAINFAKLHVEQMWGPLVMLASENALPRCKFVAAQEAAVAACDADDGVEDGVLDDPRRCTYDPKALVGTSAPDCDTFTDADADVVRKIWQGPQRQDGTFIWYGLPRGADFFGLSATGGTPLTPQPNPITLDWWEFFLTQDPDWDWTTLTYGSYEHYVVQSVEQYSAVIATNDPDLSAFRDRGGKAILWHGWNDPLIYPQGTVDYYERVQRAMGDQEKTSAFARLFMAPGVGHCFGGPGPQPTGLLEALIRWVEDGNAPDVLLAVRRDAAGNTVRTRPLCPYPLVVRYKGSGSTDDAASFECGVSVSDGR